MNRDEYNKVPIADEYERGVIDGMQKQMQSSVDKAVNKMAQREWQGLTEHEKALVMRRSINRRDAVTLTETMLREKNT
jgi:hypothetical protein